MRFYKQLRDISESIVQDYKVLCGIEEEFLIVDKKGTLVKAADDLMMNAAEILENDHGLLDSLRVKISGLDAEPNPAQIEYVTLPLELNLLKEGVESGRKLIMDAAEQEGLKILAQSLHPIQSDPHPICGTHINVSIQKQGSFMKPEHIQAVYNYLWNFLPEIIAISANSPIYQGNDNHIASNRYANSTVLKYNDPAEIKIPVHEPSLIPMRYYGRMRYKLKIGSGPDEFEKKIIANKKGDRLMDISPRGPFTNIGDDKDDSPARNRVEVRAIDIQYQLNKLLNMAHVCCVSALQAVYMHEAGKILLDPYHKENIEMAVTDGIEASFIRENSTSETAKNSINNWVESTRLFQEILGIPPIEIDFEVKDKQPELQVNYRTKDIEMQRRKGAAQAIIQINRSRIVRAKNGRKYKINAGTKLQGTIGADYNLEYNQVKNCITTFDKIEIVNFLDVQGLKVPLEKEDRILRLFSRNDFLLNQLLGGFGI